MYKLTIHTDDGEYVRMLDGVRDLRLERLGDLPHIAPQYSQRDPLWKNARINGGPTTMGSHGCLICSLSSGLSRIFESGEYRPDVVLSKLEAVSAFTGDNKNQLIWAKPPQAFPEIWLENFIDCMYVPAPLGVIDIALANNQIVLVKVDSNRVVAGVQEHWVLVTDNATAPDGQSAYRVVDSWPLPGEEYIKTIPPAFCIPTWSASRAIFSIVTYRRAA